MYQNNMFGIFVIPPILLFLLSIALAIRGFFCASNGNFGVDFFSLCDECHYSFDVDCIEHVDCFLQCSHFHNIGSANP
jgi:hypothetical protein